MRLLDALDDGGWDAVVLSLAAPHVLQSAAWGDAKSRWGWHAHRMAWGSPGEEWAAAQVLVRSVGQTRVRLGYAPRGPIVEPVGDSVRWSTVLADLEAWGRATGLLALKIDPDVPASASEVVATWRGRGWRPSATQVQFPNTMISDLSPDEASALEAMKPKTRYNIRLAERRGVRVRRGGEEDLEAFYRLYVGTGARGGFGVRVWPYYRDVWSGFLRRGMGVPILAELDGVPLAAVFPVAYGDTAWYLYGASADHGREHMPAYLAQWESIRWAVANGCRRYDWWGGPTRLAEDDPLWGVFRFKLGFGARLVEQLGAWDYPLRRAGFAVFRGIEKARLAWIAARSGRRSGTAGGAPRAL